MTRNIYLIVGAVAASAVVALVAFNMTPPAKQQEATVIATEQLRVQPTKAKQQARAASNAPLDFQTPTRMDQSLAEFGIREAGGRQVVPNALPPALARVKTELDGINQEIAEALGDNPAKGSAEADALLAEGDALIAEANAAFGLDTTPIDQQLRQIPPVTHPKLVELNQRIDALDAELDTWAETRENRTTD